MRRELRFRGWDKKGKRMGEVLSLNTLVHSPVCRIRYAGKEKAEDTLNIDLEIMQFTGLKDKAGKDIYEGDILDGNREVKFGPFYAYLENGLGGGYYITGFYYENEDGTAVPVESKHHTEVIGNIFEPARRAQTGA